MTSDSIKLDGSSANTKKTMAPETFTDVTRIVLCIREYLPGVISAQLK